MSKLRWILSRLRRTLWIRVALYAVLGMVAAMLASLSGRFLAGRSPIDINTEAIDSLLTIIASSMLAVTTFSVGALTSAYGGATANATPRATTLLTEDETVQKSLSTFVGSFLFSIVGLIALKVSFYGSEGRAVLFLFTIGVILLIVVALLRWINQLTKLGRVAHTIDLIENTTNDAMKARIAAPFLGGRALTTGVKGARVASTCVGYVQFVDVDALSEIADAAETDIDVHVLPGSFVYSGSVLASVPSQPTVLAEEMAEAVRGAFTIGSSRTFDQDPRFGLVVLSEVALRALSPAVNDPGTAIDVIGRQARLLSYWGDAWQEAETVSSTSQRVAVAALAYNDLFEDAFNLIGRDGARQVDVMLRLVKALQALVETGPAASREAARGQLQIALSRAETAMQNADDRRRLLAVVGAGSLPE